jgi:hypothetical protein
MYDKLILRLAKWLALRRIPKLARRSAFLYYEFAVPLGGFRNTLHAYHADGGVVLRYSLHELSCNSGEISCRSGETRIRSEEFEETLAAIEQASKPLTQTGAKTFFSMSTRDSNYFACFINFPALNWNLDLSIDAVEHSAEYMAFSKMIVNLVSCHLPLRQS